MVALQRHRPEEEGAQGEKVPPEAESKNEETDDPDRPHRDDLDIACGGGVCGDFKPLRPDDIKEVHSERQTDCADKPGDVRIEDAALDRLN